MPEVLSPDKPGKSLSADEVNDLFNTPDTETKETKIPAKTVKEEPEEQEEDESAEAGDDIELTEPEEETEKLELTDDITIDTPPRKKEILKEFPELFKKFPFLEKMMYRDRQITELFGSFDDAKEVAEKSETFNNFESQLLSGNTEEVLRSVKDADEKAFNIIVDDYLPTLAKVDKEAYFHVVGNLNKRLIMEMVQESNDTGNDDLKQAALIVNQFVFGTAKFTAPTNKVNRSVSAEQNEAEQEKLNFTRERFESSRDDLQSQVDNTLRATISDYIDPRGNMSAYVKKNAVADALKILTESIASDGSVPKNLDRLWKSAFDSKFSRESLNKIKSFYLSKAKANLKNAILKARSEALKDSRSPRPNGRNEEDQEETPVRQERRNIAPGRPSQPKGKNDMKKGETVTDFFMRD
jgi:hypothetical protein